MLEVCDDDLLEDLVSEHWVQGEDFNLIAPTTMPNLLNFLGDEVLRLGGEVEVHRFVLGRTSVV